LNEPLSKREIKIESIEKDVDQLKTVENVLLERSRFQLLSRLEKSEEMKALRSSIKEIESWMFSASEIVKAIGKQQQSMAEEILKSCKDLIQEYYATLCGHPHYDNLEISVSTKELKSGYRNEYEINAFNSREKSIVPAATKLSTGQLNAVALSVFLAMSMADAFSHNLNLTIIDDPSQNLDLEHMKFLQEVLEKVSRERNLIVASQDPQFQSVLEEAFVDTKAKIIRLSDYDPNHGPTVLGNES
jgi:DNA repair exonuclease SbcCD ATPase subunit